MVDSSSPRKKWPAFHHAMHLLHHLFGNGLIGWGADHTVYQVNHFHNIGLFQAACGNGRCAHAHAAGNKGATLVKGHHVLVHGYMGAAQRGLGIFTCDVFATQVY